MSFIQEMYRDDLLNRFTGHDFTETAVGGRTLVVFQHEDTIESVTDSSSIARFNFSSGPTLVVGQRVSITGFVTNTAYNVTDFITATDGTTFFEIASVAFGTNETGNFGAFIASYENESIDISYMKIRESQVATAAEVLVTLTTTQRDALTSPDKGTVIFNDTEGNPETFNGTTWVAGGGGGGGDTLQSFGPNDPQFPSSNPAAADSRNGHPILAFDDTTAENVIFSSSLGDGYTGGNIIVDIDWVAETATSGGVTWGVEFERNAPGGTDIDSDSFDTQQTGNSTTNGTSGIITRTSLSLTQSEADGIMALDSFRLRVQRVVGDGGDTMTGDAQILKVTVR